MARYTPIFLVTSGCNESSVGLYDDHEYTIFPLTSSKISILTGVFTTVFVPSVRIFLILSRTLSEEVTSISEIIDPDCSRESE